MLPIYKCNMRCVACMSVAIQFTGALGKAASELVIDKVSIMTSK